MDRAHWERIQALFHEATDRPEHERRAFLEAECGEDSALLEEVLTVLDADRPGASLLDRGLPDVASQMVGAPAGPVSSQEFGPYRLKEILGEGGMGVVWLAEREDAGNLVAIKFLPHAGLSPARRDRFTREIKTLAKLNHRYIARLYDAGTLADGTPWFAMEYVEGIPLTAYCGSRKLPIREQLRLLLRVCEAVQYAHGQEIIHRDLKPSNILVERDGTPRLLDFGIARELQAAGDPDDRTRPGLRFLSPDYAAPEWVRDGTVGFFTDVYSLGVILYEMLTGCLPENPPRKPSMASGPVALTQAEWSDLDVLCLKALHHDPEQRYQSVEAMSRDIDHYLKNEPIEARHDTVPYRLSKFVKRNRRAVLAASLASAVLVVLVVFFTVRLAQARDRANRQAAVATAINRFLSDDLLGQSDPFRSGDAQKSFVDVVNQAAPRIDLQFSAEPVVAARLHQTIARAFDHRSGFPRARQEYRRAAELFRQGDGPLSPDAILVQLQQADMEARTGESGSLERAKALLKDAQRLVSGIVHPREDLPVWLLSTRGAIALVESDARTANQDFSAALRKADGLPSIDESARLLIKQHLAASYVHLGDGAKAEALFRELMEAHAKRGGPNSPPALQAALNLSQALLIQHKFVAAINEANLIYPPLVEKLGADNEITMQLLGTRAAAEGSMGLWTDSIRDDLTLYESALTKHGPASFYSIAPLTDAAASQCSAGHYAAGEIAARKAYRESSQAFGPRAGITGATAETLANCLIGTNQLREASELLRNIDVKAVAQMIGEPTFEQAVALLQGEIAARRGDYALAQQHEQTAAPAFDRPDAPFAEKKSLQSLRAAIDSQAHRSN